MGAQPIKSLVIEHKIIKPFDSVLVSVQNGKADVGVAGISVTPERQEEVAFSQSYAVSKLVVVVRNE